MVILFANIKKRLPKLELLDSLFFHGTTRRGGIFSGCYPNATQKHGRKIRHKESTAPAHSSGSALERQFYRRIRETPC